jgi:hypothetical protein
MTLHKTVLGTYKTVLGTSSYHRGRNSTFVVILRLNFGSELHTGFGHGIDSAARFGIAVVLAWDVAAGSSMGFQGWLG